MRLVVDGTQGLHVFIEVPAEVLIDIFHHVALNNIKSIRQVCKAFNFAASQFLITRVFLSPLKADQVVLTAIAQHPIFSKRVQELVYDFRRFEARLTNKDVYASNLKICSTLSRRRQLTETIINDGWVRYCADYKEQEMNKQTKNDSRCLEAALPSMPNLKRLVVANRWTKSEHCLDHFSTQFRQSYARNAREILMLEPSEWYSGDYLQAGSGIPFYNGFLACTHAFRTGQLRTITLGQDCMVSRLSHQIFDLSQEVLQDTCDCFANLTNIEFQINTDSLDTLERHLTKLTLYSGHMAKLLSAATHLEVLNLDFESHTTLGRSDDIWSNTLRSGVWTSLHTFRLSYVTVRQQDLCHFLRRHRCSLRTLHLENMKIEPPGTWESGLKEMQCMPMNLQACRLTRLQPHNSSFGQVSRFVRSQDILDYLGFRGKNPFTACAPPQLYGKHFHVQVFAMRLIYAR